MNILSYIAFLFLVTLVLLGKGFVTSALVAGAVFFVVPVLHFGRYLLFPPGERE